MASDWFDESYYLDAKVLYNNNFNGGAGVDGINTWNASTVLAAFAANGLTPEEHYLQYGWTEGLSPNANYNETDYVNSKVAQLNADAFNGKTDWTATDFRAAWGTNPFTHYLQYGAYETGVNPSASFDDDAYYAAKTAELNATSFDGRTNWTTAEVITAFQSAGITPLGHYDTFGASENLIAKALTFTTATESLTGSYANDTISGIVDGTLASTFMAGDSLDGLAGTDTLTLTNVAGTMTLPTDVTVKNIENLILNSGANAITADVSGWTGLESITATQTGVDANITITTESNATSVSVTGGLAVAIADDGTTNTLATVSLDGNTGVATIDSDALTTLSIANTDQNATVSAAAGTRALGLTLDTLAGGIITDATATSVTVDTTGGASTIAGLSTAAATSLTVNADQALIITTLTDAALTSIVITGDSDVSLTTAAGTNPGTVDASAATGAITFDGALMTTASAITGGSGNDTLTGGAVADTISGGAGDDTLTGGTGADILTGGTGTNIFAFAEGDTGIPTVTNFDTITDWTAGTNIIDDTTTNITFMADTTGGLTINAAGLATAADLGSFITGASASTNSGEGAIWSNGTDSYLFISDGVAGLNSNDLLIKVTDVNATTGLTLTGGNITGIA